MRSTLLVIWFATGLVFCVPPLWGQTGEAKKDSLEKVLKASKGMDRLPALLAYFEIPGTGSNPDNYSLALEALSLAQHSEDPHDKANSHSNLATLHYYKGHFDSSKYHQKLALEVYKQEEDSLGMAQVLNGLGVLLDIAGEPDSSLSYYFQALGIRKRMDDQMGVSTTLNNIAVLYQFRNEFEKALVYFKQSLEIDLKIGNESNLASTYSNIGTTYSSLGQFDEAIRHHRLSLDLRRKSNNPVGISKSLNNLAMAYEKDGQFSRAVQHFEESLQLKRQAGNDYETARTLTNLGALHISMKNPEKAIEILGEARQMTDTTELKPLRERILDNLSRAYFDSGQYKEAYSVQQEAQVLKRELALADRENNMNELIARFEAMEQEQRIDSLRYQQSLSDQKVASYQQRMTLLVTGLGFIGALSLLLLYLLFKNRKYNQALRTVNHELEDRNKEIAQKNAAINEQRDLLATKNKEILLINSNLENIVEERTRNLLRTNKELDTFLYQTSHALRAPLMRVIGLFSILKKEEDPGVVEEMYHLADETIEGMDAMLYKLLEVQEAKLRTLDPIRLDMEMFIGEILEALEPGFGKPDRLVLDVPKEKLGVPDRFLFRVILSNLLENALQFRSSERPLDLSVTITPVPGELVVEIMDNGTGIGPEILPQVFNMFFRGTHKSQGTGLGLYVVEKVVEKLGGSTKLESEPDRFTRITVRLPRPQEALAD